MNYAISVAAAVWLAISITTPVPVTAEVTSTNLNVMGFATGPKGERFAMVRGVGVVIEGQKIFFSIPGEKGSMEIMRIDTQGEKIEYRVVDVVKHDPVPLPEVKPAAKPPRPATARDPFWPVGYMPE